MIWLPMAVSTRIGSALALSRFKVQVIHDLFDFYCIDNRVVKKVQFLETSSEPVELAEGC